MKAEQLFKQIGFKKYKNKYDKQAEKEWGIKDVFFRYKSKQVEVSFDCLDEDYCVYGTGLCLNVAIDVELHNAITKQIEELGWNNER